MTSARRGIILLALGTLLASSASAQRTTRLGPIGGLNLATVSGEGVDVDSRTGLALGGFVSFDLSPTFGIETGLLYSQRGFELSQSGFSAEIKLDYLELPVLAVVRFPGSSNVRPFLGAGAAIGFKAGCGFKVSGGPITVSGGCDDVEDELDSALKSTDFGALGQAGVDIGDFRVLVRYNLGLSSIVDTPVGDPAIKNRTLSLLVGYGFRLQ